MLSFVLVVGARSVGAANTIVIHVPASHCVCVCARREAHKRNRYFIKISCFVEALPVFVSLITLVAAAGSRSGCRVRASAANFRLAYSLYISW